MPETELSGAFSPERREKEFWEKEQIRLGDYENKMIALL
jgi:hypothetical protein